jgi:hypothetical protein
MEAICRDERLQVRLSHDPMTNLAAFARKAQRGQPAAHPICRDPQGIKR